VARKNLHFAYDYFPKPVKIAGLWAMDQSLARVEIERAFSPLFFSWQVT
jgi:hypothetical protein